VDGLTGCFGALRRRKPAPNRDTRLHHSATGLQRIATRFARKCDNLNRPAANAPAKKLKKYD
jgi:hypothetical protein